MRDNLLAKRAIELPKPHEKRGWKKQLLEDVKSVRSEVRRRGGIKQKAINDAIKKYRKSVGCIRSER